MNSKTQPTPLYAIGLDVGGTKIAAGIVAWPSAEVLHYRVIPTRTNRGGKPVLQDTVALATELIELAAHEQKRISAIGVAVAELISLRRRITSAHSIQWCDLPVVETLSELAPTVIESDVRAAALAEAKCGAGKQFANFAYVTVGTGISYSLVIEGHPYAGARGNALILASSPLSTRCGHCGAALEPILEEFASGPALARRYQQLHKPDPSLSCEQVFAAAEAGDEDAVNILESAGEALGVSVAFLINTLDPEAVIVGGGLGLAGGIYWERFVHSTREHIWAESTRSLPILSAGLNCRAGVIGAAITAFQEHDIFDGNTRRQSWETTF